LKYLASAVRKICGGSFLFTSGVVCRLVFVSHEYSVRKVNGVSKAIILYIKLLMIMSRGGMNNCVVEHTALSAYHTAKD